MYLHTKCRFFKISTLINFIFLVLTAILFCAFGDHIYSFHSKMFPITKEEFYHIGYGFIGLYKLFFWFFNFVPMIALCCLCRCPKTHENHCDKGSCCGSNCSDGANGSCAKK